MTAVQLRNQLIAKAALEILNQRFPSGVMPDGKVNSEQAEIFSGGLLFCESLYSVIEKSGKNSFFNSSSGVLIEGIRSQTMKIIGEFNYLLIPEIYQTVKRELTSKSCYHDDAFFTAANAEKVIDFVIHVYSALPRVYELSNAGPSQ